MKELVAITALVVSAMTFLVGFTTRGSSYVTERQAYYRSMESQLEDPQSQAVMRLAADRVFLGNIEEGYTRRSHLLCVEGPYPRMTTFSWMGATDADNRKWHIRNEKACIDRLMMEFKAAGNTVGQLALERIQLPAR